MSITLIGIVGIALVLTALRRQDAPERELVPIPVDR